MLRTSPTFRQTLTMSMSQRMSVNIAAKDAAVNRGGNSSDSDNSAGPSGRRATGLPDRAMAVDDSPTVGDSRDGRLVSVVRGETIDTSVNVWRNQPQLTSLNLRHEWYMNPSR